MSFIADDLGAWLIAVLADVGRKKVTDLVFGTEQERALRQVAAAAITIAAEELQAADVVRAKDLAMVINEVFGESLPEIQLASQSTFLETLQAGVARQLSPLGDPTLTGTGESSAQILNVSLDLLQQKLTSHLLRQIVEAGARGGPLAPLANQLNHEATYLQGLRVEGKVDRLAEEMVRLAARQESLASLPEVVSLDNSGDTASSAPSPSWLSLAQEKILLEFEKGINLITPRLLVLLEDYYSDLIGGTLSGYSFSSAQITPQFSPEYLQAKRLHAHYIERESRRLLRLEQDLIEGVRILLDVTFIQEMQTRFAVMGVANFARLKQHQSIALICSQISREVAELGSLRDFSGNPLSSSSEAAEFYGHEVMLMDLWNPKDPKRVLKCWLPRDGYVGSWFSRGYRIPPDGYVSHYDPSEHYGYILPQAVMSFFRNGNPIPFNFNEYMIGQA